MDIRDRGITRNIGRDELNQLRQNNRIQLMEKLREISPADELMRVPESQRKEVVGFFDGTITDISLLRQPRFPQGLERFFNFSMDDLIIDSATRTQESDNEKAREIKGEYRELMDELKRDRALAEKMMTKR